MLCKIKEDFKRDFCSVRDFKGKRNRFKGLLDEKIERGKEE